MFIGLVLVIIFLGIIASILILLSEGKYVSDGQIFKADEFEIEEIKI